MAAKSSPCWKTAASRDPPGVNSAPQLVTPARIDAALETTPAVGALRDLLREARATLLSRFEAGEEADALVAARAGLADALLHRLWQRHLHPVLPRGALVAVGGYGRGELLPYSDIDLLILLPAAEDTAVRQALEGFITLLWDIGLEVGHSVRTVEECRREAAADITVATNLMEARLLCGDEATYDAMLQATAPGQIWPSRDFFAAKWQEQIERHQRYNDTAYNLEPNIKESPGGLRDIQMVGWVAKRHFGATTLHQLVEHGFLTHTEHDALIEGQRTLWRIRCGLHLISGRREDRLLFDHQRTLAARFGYRDGNGRLAVEHFMKDYYRTIGELGRLNEMLLQLFQEEILHGAQQTESVTLNRRFRLHDGFIEATRDDLFDRYRTALLELFLLMARHPECRGVRAGTIRQVRDRAQRIDDAFRADLGCRTLFIELLREPSGVSRALKRMHRYGVLGAWLPEFGRIIGQMQHDLFHVYSVDEHTLKVVENARRFAHPHYAHEFPQCSAVMQRLPKPELLTIAALYHDIAKGRGGDHSQLGAVDATAFCERHNLSRWDTRLVTWLVEHHLLFSTTAQRIDSSDPQAIHAFAEQIGDPVRLDYLYLLTVADIRATSPTLWNSWKERLLGELYQATRRALRRGLHTPVMPAEAIDDIQQQARRQLHQLRLQPSQVERIWQRLGDEYFLRHSVDEILWHAQGILMHDAHDTPLVMLRQDGHRGGTELFIHAPEHANLFTLITTTLDQLGLSVADARILGTHDGWSLDTFILLDEQGAAAIDPLRGNEIVATLRQRLTTPDQLPARVERRLPRQYTHFRRPTRISFTTDLRNARTVMEVITSDRPGLLSHIARVVQGCGVHLQNAKVSTFGERAEDIFFLTAPEGGPLDEATHFDCLHDGLISALDGAATPPTMR